MELGLIGAAPFAVQSHLWAALAALVVGGVNLMREKGTRSHRWLGRVWVGLMAFVALSSFWIHEIDLWRGYSPIHLLSIYVLAMLPLGVWSVRRGNVRGHRNTMVATFVGGLVIAGLFTLLPGRLIGRALFGAE